MIYFISLLYCLFLVYRYDIKKTESRYNTHYYILLAIAICVAGFSYRLGTDTFEYMRYFDLYVDGDIEYVWENLKEMKYEPIPVILFSICKSVINDFALVQFVIAIFVNCVFFWFLRKHSSMFFFSVFLYFIFQYWNMNFEIKRESIAISFFLIGYDKLIENGINRKSLLQFIAWCIPAILSHRYAFVVMFLPIFQNLRLNIGYILTFAVLSFAIFLERSFVTNLFWVFNGLFAFFNVNDSIIYYITSSEYGIGNLTIFGYIESIFLPVVIIASVRNYCRKEVFGMALGFLIMKLLMAQVFIFYRLCNYLCLFLFIAYAEVLASYMTKRVNKVNVIALLLVIVLLFRGKVLGTGLLPYYPYNSIFTKEYVIERENLYQLNY